jgi:DNA repair exonuclease SbcCD ATPase subunit
MAEDLAALVRAAREQADRDSGRAQQVAVAGQAAEAEVARLTEQVALHARVAALFSTVGEQAQNSAREQFEALATHALRVIFGDGLSFRLVAGETGGQATLEATIRTERAGVVTETSVVDAQGGGVAAVTGFVMRLVMVMLTPTARKVLFLDETFAFLSESYTAALAEFLYQVTRRAGVQIVLVTHDPVYAQYADVKVRFVPGADGMTVVREGESELWPLG